MSDKFPQLPFRKVRRVLEYLGCVFVRRKKGSHCRFRRGDCIFSLQDQGKTEIPEGTVRSALDAAEITRKQYIQAYKEVFKK